MGKKSELLDVNSELGGEKVKMARRRLRILSLYLTFLHFFDRIKKKKKKNYLFYQMQQQASINI